MEQDKVVKFKEALAQSNEQEEKEFLQAYQEIIDLNKDDPIFNEINSLMELDDKEFELVAPAILDELERSYNEPNNIMVLTRTLNAGGIKLEDLKASFEEIDNQLDTASLSISMRKIDFLKQMCAIIYNAVENSENLAKRVIAIPISFCKEGARLPEYAHLTDAGMDVYALEDITIAPGETKLIPTGIKVAIPNGYEIQVRPKSGRCLKTKLRVANTPGTIDSGYRDEIGVIIENVDPPIKKIESEPILNADGTFDGLKVKSIEYGQSYTIGKGEKFAQLVLSEVTKASFYEVSDVSNIANDGRNGGYGSSGLK